MKTIYCDEKSDAIYKDLCGKVSKAPLTMLMALSNSGRGTWLRSQIKEEIVIDLAADMELEEWIKEERMEGDKKVVLVVNSLDVIDRPNRYENWKRIITLYYRFPERVKLIVGQGSEEVENARDLLRDLYPYYLNNRVWLTLMNEGDMANFGLSDKELIQLSGGYLPLVKRSLEVGRLEIEDEAVDFALETLWESLSEDSQKKLKLLVLGKPADFGEYLTNTGVVINGKPFSPLFGGWIKKMMTSEVLELEEMEGKLMLKGGIELEKLLSFQEYEVLKKLWQSKGVVVTRNEIADVMWGSKSEENYSDWAIDQVVSKLRRKIGDVGEERLIKTVKGKGFLMGK